MALPDDVSYFLFIGTVDDLRTRPLPVAGLLTVGRSRSSDIRLADKQASAHHAVLEVGAGFSITDLQSRNGTRVRDRLIPPLQPTPIRPGDVVWIGETLLMIELGMEPHAVGPSPAHTDTRPDTQVSSAPAPA